MRHALITCALILVSWIPFEAQTPMASPGPDPYAGSIKGRVYSSSFFGFSCEIPKGLQSQAALIEELRESRALKNKSSLDTIEAQYRDRGILLQATRTGDREEMADAFRRPVWDIAHPPALAINPRFGTAFVIVASPIADSGGPGSAMEMAESRAAQIRANHPEVVVSAPGRVMLNGQPFARLDASQSPPGGKQKSGWFASDFVTVRNGYMLEFMFSADGEQELLRVIKAMGTVHFQAP